MRRSCVLGTIIISIALLLASCTREPCTESELLLGTLCSVTSYGREAEDSIQDVFSLIREKEKIFDRHHEGSELFSLNRDAFSSPVKVSGELFDLIRKSLEIAEKTDGLFNPAIGPLVDLWGIGTDHAKVPTEEEIAETLTRCDFHDIVLDENEKTVSFLTEGMSIDLGAVAKGYISDKAAELLRNAGVESAIINLGGNVYAVGAKTDGRDWTVGLQDPASERGELYYRVHVSDRGVLTSGGYERFFTDPDTGRTYHHILDSRTGYPADSDLVSTTVISEDAALADALSTACFAAGKERAREILGLFGVAGVFLDTDGNVTEVNI